MSKFITGKNLEKVIYDIIWDAEQTLLIVSPFIKLDDYFKKLFDKHNYNHKLHIIIVFGKNEKDLKKSFNKEDFEYFKKFLNISVIYAPTLHAKYYGNEKKGVITSINLYDYSFKNNIEFGVFSEATILTSFTNNISNNTDQDAWDTSLEIAKNSEAIFIKRPVYEKKLLSTLLGKNFIKSEEMFDQTERFYKSVSFIKNDTKYKKLFDFPAELELGAQNSIRPDREELEFGFCIRTGEKIPFNIKKPYSDKAYKSWSEYENKDYKEKYCHKSGDKSGGKTSMRNPILK